MFYTTTAYQNYLEIQMLHYVIPNMWLDWIFKTITYSDTLGLQKIYPSFKMTISIYQRFYISGFDSATEH